MSPNIHLSLHSIGGFACISPYNPPPEGSGTSFSTPPAFSNGLNPSYNRLVHCMAAEPLETLLKVAVVDGESEVAYETCVLGVLRPGYRCFQMRSTHGTRCAAVVFQIPRLLGFASASASTPRLHLCLCHFPCLRRLRLCLCRCLCLCLYHAADLRGRRVVSLIASGCAPSSSI